MNFVQVNEEIGNEARIFAPDGIPPIGVQFEQKGDGYVAEGWTCKMYPDALVGAGPRWEYRKTPTTTGVRRQGEAL